MKNFILSVLCVLSLSALADKSHAQACSTTENSTLQSCVDSGVESCRSGSACDDYQTVLTITDVREIAINACCGKSSRTGRSLCLVKERRKYTAKVSSGAQKSFFKAARSAVNDVRKNVCKNSTYEFPSDSVLF